MVFLKLLIGAVYDAVTIPVIQIVSTSSVGIAEYISHGFSMKAMVFSIEARLCHYSVLPTEPGLGL